MNLETAMISAPDTDAMKRDGGSESIETALPPEMMAREQEHVGPKPDDPMRRFLATPHSALLSVMGRAVRFETNDSSLLKFVVELFSGYPTALDRSPDFLWKIVVEADASIDLVWPRRSAFSHPGLRFVQFGQRTFLAVDLEARRAVAVLSESLARNELGLTTPFFDNLFLLTVGSLGLVPLWANCVARNHTGVLLFGPPNSGKTSASYLATEVGLDFHADEGVFLDLDSNGLHCWGGFWPAAFREETLQSLPGLGGQAGRCLHEDFAVYHAPTQLSQSKPRKSVTPTCCLFLERQASAIPQLLQIQHHDLARLLTEYLLFEDDDRFAKQQIKVLTALAEVPAYSLRYGNDPKAVSATIANISIDELLR
jgi:hypothetical protein